MSDKKEQVPTNVAKADKLAQELLRLLNILVDISLLSNNPVNPRQNPTELTAESENAKARMVDLDSVKILTVRMVRPHQELMDEINQRHAEKVIGIRELSRKNAESLCNDVKLGKGTYCQDTR